MSQVYGELLENIKNQFDCFKITILVVTEFPDQTL